MRAVVGLVALAIACGGSGEVDDSKAIAGGAAGADPCGAAPTCVERCRCAGGSEQSCLVACGPGASGAGGTPTGGASGLGGSSGSGAEAGVAGTGATAGTAGAAATAGTAGTGASGASGAGGSAGAPGLATLGALVILGDSISDGGGVGPFYYNLLRDSLTARYGAIAYEHRAQSGSKTSALVGQIGGLPGSLPSPVAVCITSGGNDMKDNVVAVATGADDALVAAMGANVGAALGALGTPGRFGTGTDVFVYEATVYDATDGQGNFMVGGCNVSFPVVLPTDPFFAKWNGEITNQVSAHGQVLADMHGRFYNHGFNNPPNWYASDCTHPSSLGHDQLRRYFYELITGEQHP